MYGLSLLNGMNLFWGRVNRSAAVNRFAAENRFAGVKRFSAGRKPVFRRTAFQHMVVGPVTKTFRIVADWIC